MEQYEKDCCAPANRGSKGVVSGVLYGLIPHAFCIAFILFSVIGAVTMTSVFREFLLIPYFFYVLVAVSLLLAGISSAVYLKKCGRLSVSGAKSRWKYIAALFSSTILINALMFFAVFPALANMNSGDIAGQERYSAGLSAAVQIPCSGHAPLIIYELKKNAGVGAVKFKIPNIFEVKYDPRETSSEEIAAAEIFKTYPAIIK